MPFPSFTLCQHYSSHYSCSVPDDKIEEAATIITSGTQYERVDSPPKEWLECSIFDPACGSCFPSSLYLKSTVPADLRNWDEPKEIYLHPQSFFNIDVSDHSRSVTLASTLPPTFAALRFPTRPAFFDSLLETRTDPPHGRRSFHLSTTLASYIAYLFTYTLRAYPNVLPDGQLEPEHARVCASLRPENRPLFEEFIRPRTQCDPGGDRQRLARRELLKAQGRPINRPLPSYPVGYKLRQGAFHITGLMIVYTKFTMLMTVSRRPLSAGLSEFSTTASVRRLATLARRIIR
ncbi:hypothetical protein B0H11DRAFT_1294977 [Mycena galericulata]|nr:hypothetical protein B0H11DRAFT_1294977 [Mycena galericulata]